MTFPLRRIVGGLVGVTITAATVVAEPQRNLNYDTKHERNVLDYWPAKSKGKPTPVFVWFHGGGFRQGDKKLDGGASAWMREAYQEAGYAVVSCNYPFLNKGAGIDYMDIVIHCARAVQFVRSKAEEWNIDPARLCCGGVSAGALISEALGYHDDFADSNAKDKVARLSSRPAVVVSHMQPIGTRDFALRYMEKGEAPLFLFSDAAENDRIHNPAEALKIRDKARELGIPCEALSLGRNKLAAVKDHKEMLGRQLKFCEKHLSR
ncbi:MAG: alpha/beta hydrolase [Roseibacillus sp.]